MKKLKNLALSTMTLTLLLTVGLVYTAQPVEAAKGKPLCRCAPDPIKGKLPTEGKWKVQCYDGSKGNQMYGDCDEGIAPKNLCEKSGAKADGDCNPITDAVISGPFQIPTLGALMTSLVRLFFFISGILALFYLLSGAFDWIRSAGADEEITKAQKKIMAAILGLVVMVSVLTLVIIIEQVIFSGTVCLGVSCPIELDDIRLVTPN